ncbi:hypothetical protein HY990_02850 [Candidatus Micrarchaeota archaeon]|nr:hypothetical protein [Candidatus Micrarchaeota archaeon]
MRIWLVGLFLVTFILLSGCVKESIPPSYNVSAPSVSQINQSVPIIMTNLSTGCAYDNPSCDTNFTCVNNSCVLSQGCQFNNPSCSGGFECRANHCVALKSCEKSRTFNMLVFMDDNSYSVTDGELYAYFNQAGDLLFNITCTNINVIKIWHISLSKIEDLDTITGTLLKENSELTNSANGFVFFSHLPDCAKNNGGCAWSIAPGLYDVTNYCNSFSYKEQSNLIYGSLVDWNHKFGACGYDSNGNHTSDTSLGGECRNQPDTPCVARNGYYMCKNLIDDYYASDNSIFTITTIIHEIMHHFGDNGNMDHFGTSTCESHGSYVRDFYCPTTDDFECYAGMCPYTYDNFENSKNIC